MGLFDRFKSPKKFTKEKRFFISFLKFPRNVINRIFRFLDCEILARMRKISKSSKEFVDTFILRTQTSDILLLHISRDWNKVELFMNFSCGWDKHVWTNFASTALDKLSITTATLDVSVLVLFSTHNMNLTIDRHGMQQFLEYLKPLIQTFKIDRFELADDDPKSVRMFTEFVSGMHVDIVRISLQRSSNYAQNVAAFVRKVLRKSTQINYDQYLAFIANANPNHVDFFSQNYELARDSVEFLIRLADSVKSILIFHGCDGTSHPSFNPIIMSILSRKCGKLEIIDSCESVHISASETEQLLQFLHHSEKKFWLALWNTSSHLPSTQRGQYTVRSVRTHVWIKHIHFQSLLFL